MHCCNSDTSAVKINPLEKIGKRSVHVGSRKKISEVSQIISGFVIPHLLHYSVPLYLLHLQICLLGNTLFPISSHPPRSQNGM